MPSAINRAPITARLIEELETPGFPVGDNSSPETDYGWQGEPNSVSSSFIPYLGISPMNSLPQKMGMGGSMGDSATEWILTYTIWYAGVTRKQTEALADRLRGQLTNIAREGIGDTEKWRIQQIRCIAIGANTRVGSAYPDYYTQTDTFEVWASKER